MTRQPIDHSKPLVYEVRDVTTGDVLVFDTHAAALRQFNRIDPKHVAVLEARNPTGGDFDD